jgi:SAM-dependent methyltransferase
MISRPVDVEPYSRLAASYDATLGAPHLSLLVPRFEELASRLGLGFDAAADLGCGTGLFTSYLCRRWRVPVVGVDRSHAMLRLAARRLARLPARLLLQDLRALRLPHPVNLATLTFDTLNHLTRADDVRRLFRRIASHLRPGGHLFFDALTPAQPLGPGQVLQRYFRRRGHEVAQRIRWDPTHRMLRGLIVESRGGRPVALERHVERTYHVGELARWLRDAGLRVRALVDAITLRPATSLVPRVFVVAVRG